MDADGCERDFPAVRKADRAQRRAVAGRPEEPGLLGAEGEGPGAEAGGPPQQAALAWCSACECEAWLLSPESLTEQCPGQGMVCGSKKLFTGR